MTTPVFPSIHALRSNDERLLAHELRLGNVRTQAAVVRALLDEVERLAPRTALRAPVSVQLVEEIARCGCNMLEVARALAKTLDREQSTPECGREAVSGAA